MGSLHHDIDRETIVADSLRNLETWRGFILDVPDTIKIPVIKEGLDALLVQHGYRVSRSKDNIIYCKGPYSPQVVEDIKKYLKESPKIGHPVIVAKGNYDNFIGDYWVGEVKDSLNQN